MRIDASVSVSLTLCFVTQILYIVCCAVIYLCHKATLSQQAFRASAQDVIETALPFDLSEKNARDCFFFFFCAVCDQVVLVIMIFFVVCVFFLLASFGAVIYFYFF